MLKSLKSLAALILCLSMAISFTSCYGDTNEWAVEINGEKISSGVYLGYLVNAYSAATTELSSKEGYTENKIFEMTIEEKSVEQWIKDKALESCKLYVATNKMFDEYKCEINSELKATINKAVETQWETSSQYYETNGCSKSSYKKMIEASYKQNVLFLKIYDKDGTNPVADEELQKFFVENYAKAKIATASLLDSTTNQAITDEEKTKLSEKFDNYVTRIKNGEDADKILDEYSKELEEQSKTSTDSTVSEEPSNNNSSETTSTEEVNVDRNSIIIYKENTDYPADFTKKIFEMQINTTEKFEITNFLIFANKVSLEGNKENFEANRTDALANMKSAEFAEKIKATSETYEVKMNDSAISRFNPKNIPNNFVTTSTAATQQQTQTQAQ